MIQKLLLCIFCLLLFPSVGDCKGPEKIHGLSKTEFITIVKQYLPEEYVYHMLAIAKTESDYGKSMGRFNAYDQIKDLWESSDSKGERRFWWKNIKALEQIGKDNGKKFYSYKGSSAGALGYMQILPTTFTQYGRDGNGDGKKDPLNPYDSVATASNYVKDRISRCDTTWTVIKAYNNSNHYVRHVLKTSEELRLEDEFKAFLSLLDERYRRTLTLVRLYMSYSFVLSKLEY